MRGSRDIPLALIVAATTVFGIPARADGPGACTTAPTFDAVLSALAGEGWSPIDTPTDAQADTLAWALSASYLAGDTGGETPDAIHALQRRAVPGLARKVDTDTTRTRLLADGAGGAMILTQTRTMPDRVERTCQIAAGSPFPNAPSGMLAFDASAIPDAPRTLIVTHTVLTEEVSE
ncbi:hypothetical protein [Jannaschia sp. LMIT008]|uniref:hypothetical protein n=1 Tax=Jannaschia maritima TaxID=3032585 RepID=UPI0028116A47|nr:hypothetical protein [Jannaschia sp. LMIT008]